jgi:hypothetical protein
MPLPGSAWLSLADTVRFVIEATGEPVDRVCSALTEAALAGTITASGCRHASAFPNRKRYYFAHPVLYDRESVPAAAWGTAIDWPQSRVGIYDLVRFDRGRIEQWLGSAADQIEVEAAPAAAAGTVEPQQDAAPVGVPAFVAHYVGTEKRAGRQPTKKGLLGAWQKASRKGHRDALINEFIQLMGDAAPSRGRPRKIAK